MDYHNRHHVTSALHTGNCPALLHCSLDTFTTFLQQNPIFPLFVDPESNVSVGGASAFPARGPEKALRALCC